MGVVLRNLQKVVPLRRARLRKDVDTLRHILGIQKFDLAVICVDNDRIQQINNKYRKKNVPTDVLSFPFYEVRFVLWPALITQSNVATDSPTWNVFGSRTYGPVSCLAPITEMSWTWGTFSWGSSLWRTNARRNRWICTELSLWVPRVLFDPW